MKIFNTICYALVLVFAGSSGAYSQTVFGTIKGVVTDSIGSVVPGAKISFVRLTEKGSEVRKVTTDYAGGFVSDKFPLGMYRLTVDVSGINRQFSRNVELTNLIPAHVDIVVSFAACSDENEESTAPKITVADHAAIVRELVDQLIGTSHFNSDKAKKKILTQDNFDLAWLSNSHLSRISIMTRTAIQDLTEKTDSLQYYSITAPKQKGSCVAISLLNSLTVKGQIEDANMAGREDIYEFRKVDGKWVGLLLSSLIS